jgi:hypothetical protein
LHQLLRGGWIAHHAIDVAEQRRGPAPEERIEGGRVPRSHGEHQPDVVVAVVQPRLRRSLEPDHRGRVARSIAG